MKKKIKHREMQRNKIHTNQFILYIFLFVSK